jgi:hypothetical protein
VEPTIKRGRWSLVNNRRLPKIRLGSIDGVVTPSDLIWLNKPSYSLTSFGPKKPGQDNPELCLLFAASMKV